MLMADDDDHHQCIAMVDDHLQSKRELKKQVEEKFCINVKNFLRLAGAHLLNLIIMITMMMMMMVVVEMIKLVM